MSIREAPARIVNPQVGTEHPENFIPWRGKVTVKVVPVGPAAGSACDCTRMSPQCIFTMP